MRPHLRPALAAGILGVLSAGLVTTPAQAAAPNRVYTEINGDGTNSWYLMFQAGAGNRNTPVFTRSGNTITIDDRVPLQAGAGCTAVTGDRTKVRCTRALWYDVIANLGDGDDTLTNRTTLRFWGSGEAGNDVLHGSAGFDLFHGNDGNDTLYGNGGDDQLDGGAGVDKLWGGTGADGLVGGPGNDVMHGQSGNDHLIGQAGADLLYGEDGNDNLEGGSGNDKQYGGDGADLLRSRPYGGADADYFSGGTGTDVVSYEEKTTAVTADADGVKGDDGVKGEKDTIATDVNVIVGGSGDDRLSGVYGRAVRLVGGPGNDTLRITGSTAGRSGRNILDGGANRTAAGDLCTTVAPRTDERINCER
ncbi:calcium-binding protein [Actinoplanes rectilineatus]|uniref:calcium-binding protein n=1 Tax=Actinoplanes rectilineatus TaxID=113571 RepID=UPI0006975F5B|nr:calcium-binding protein [Actinoplanes rectilineatus]